MVLNLAILNMILLTPTRSVQKIAGPLEVSFINAARISIGRLNRIIKMADKIRSNVRFNMMF